MVILGIDPGLRATGYGVIGVEEGSPVKLLEVGTIKPPRSGDLSAKVQSVHRNLDEIITQHSPAVMVLEKIYTHHNHPTTASVLGHVRGVICLLSAQRRIRLEEYSVKRIRKALIGNGNASKQQMQEAVAGILKVNPERLTLDASDALTLALGYAQLAAFSEGASL